MNKTYSEATLRRRAKRLGYVLSKGFLRLANGPIFYDCNNNRYTGYTIMDYQTRFVIYGYNGSFINILDLTDVEDILKEEYEKYGMQW